MSLLKKQLLNTTVYNLFTWVNKLMVFPIIVKSFEISEYGIYGMLNMLVVYGSIVGSAELYAFLRKELPGKERNYQLSMYKSVHLPFLLFIIVLVAVLLSLNLEYVIAPLIGASNLDAELTLVFLIIVAEIGIKDIIRYFVSVKKIQLSNFLSFFNQQAWGLIIISLYFLEFDITIMLWLKIRIFTTFLSWFVGLNLIGLKELYQAEWDIANLGKAFAFSSVILLGVFMTQTGNFLSRYLITEMVSVKAVGLFFFSMKLPQIANGFSTNLINKVSRVHLIEAINNDDLEKMRTLGGKLLIFNVILYTILILPIMVNIDGLILLFGKEEYLVTKPLIYLLFCSFYFQIFSLTYYTYLFAKGRKDLMFYISLGKLLANTLLLAAFIYLFGLIGAAYAFVASHFLNFVISFFPYRKSNLIKLPSNINKFIWVGVSVVLLFLLQLYSKSYFSFDNLYYIFISSFISVIVPMGLFMVVGILQVKGRKVSINW